MNKEIYNLLMDKQPEDRGRTIAEIAEFLSEYRVVPPDNPPERIEFSNPSPDGYTVYYPPSREDFWDEQYTHWTVL